MMSFPPTKEHKGPPFLPLSSCPASTQTPCDPQAVVSVFGNYAHRACGQ